MGLPLSQLAEALGAELHGDPGALIDRVAPLHRATAGALSFLSNRRYAKHLNETKATAVIVSAADHSLCPVAALVVENPYLGYARAAALLAPLASPQAGVHPTAWVSPAASIAASVWVGPQAVVEANALVGERTFVGPGCVVGEGVKVGEDCRLVANVTLCHGIEIGDRVMLHPGVVIGADGFGIANDGGVWVKVMQVGRALLGDDVEVGANSTIDRGALDDTVIENGVKIDNLVQIGHNVRIGEHTAVAGCVGIAGSATIGKRCTIGGGAGVSGHLELADDVHLTGATLVHRSITKAGIYSSGMVAQDNAQWRKTTARLRHLDEMARRIKSLEFQLASPLASQLGAKVAPESASKRVVELAPGPNSPDKDREQ